MGKREVKQSPVKRGIDEEYAYKFDLTGKVWSGTQDSPVNAIYLQNEDGTFGSDLSATLLSGNPTIVDNVFTTSSFVANQMTAGKRYKLEFGIDIGGKAVSWYLFIDTVD
jgi:hypothetical protein